MKRTIVFAVALVLSAIVAAPVQAGLLGNLLARLRPSGVGVCRGPGCAQQGQQPADAVKPLPAQKPAVKVVPVK